MPRPPNYSQERKDRERLKAAKKTEKLAARQAAREQKRQSETDAGADSPHDPVIR